MDCARRFGDCLSDISEMATGRVRSCNVRIFATGKRIPTINASDPRVNSASSAVGIDRQLDYRASFVIIWKWREEKFLPLFMLPPSPFKHAPPVTTQISRYRAASSLASHEFAGMELHPNPLTLRIQPFPLWFRVLQFQFCRLAVMENFWSLLLLPLSPYCQSERQ